MNTPFPGPLAPDQLEATQSYWNTPGLTSSAAPPPPTAPDPVMSYYGAAPPAPAPSQAVTPTASGPTGALTPSDFGFGVDVQPTVKPGAPPASPPPSSAPPPVTTLPEVTVAGHAPPPPGPRGPSAIDRAETNLRGTYDEERAGLQGLANADRAKSDAMSMGTAQLARTKMDDEANAQFEAAHAAETFQKYQDETQRQIDDVKSMKIQPNRAYADGGSAATAVIGGLLGGIYQGLNHLQSNPFIDQMNKVIDRDIAAQQEAINNKKGAIQDRKGLLAEMRATYKDESLAKAQAKNLYYEGMKEQLGAEAAQYDSPAIQARADQGIAAINREQAKLDLNKALNDAAARSAQSAAAAHQAQKDFDNKIALQKLQNETLLAGGTVSKDMAAAAKDRAEAGGAGNPRDPVSLVPKEQRASAITEREAYTKAQNQAAHIDTLFAQYDKTGFMSQKQLNAYRASIATAVKAGAGPGMSSDEDYVRFIEPALPTQYDTADTLRVKRENLKNAITASVATPTLDTHAPGWNGPPKIQTFDLNGRPQ